MRAIWSFWSLPYRVHQRTRWFSHRHHLLSWVLSVETASRFFPETALYTDDEGAALLVDRLGLRFTEVSTALDDLNGQDGDWWVLGKLYTYRAQRQPFVHFDSDVYLWQAFLTACSPPPFSRRIRKRPGTARIGTTLTVVSA